MNRLITKIVLVLTILFAGCHDDVMEGVLPAGQPEQPQRALVTLQGIVGDGPITRTQIDGNRFSWLATDTIGVFYSAATDKRPVPFIVHQLSDDGASAVFVSIDSLDWVPDESGYVYAYYPWREDVVDQLPLTIDSIQEQTDAVASHTGRFDYMRADSVGYALPATTLHFRHLVALTDLVYRNTGAEDIRFDSLTITPSQADAWPVQGTTGMLPSDGGFQPTAQATVLKTVVKGDALTVAPGKSLPVRVVMLPADLSDLTMTIRVYTSAGDTVFTKPGLDFCAGKRYIMRLSSEEDDFDRLMTIYRETNGSKWTNNTNWGSDRPLSEWYGVSCDANGRVTQLWLTYNGLSGSLSAIMDKLTELTELTSISFEGNQLSGEIPAALGSLTNLTNLYLSNNTLSGTLPAELGQLKKLYQLSLYNNKLEGALPKELGQLTHLGYLSLNDNKFSGELPVELDSLTNLYSLQLQNNNLEGQLPKELGGLKKLSTLRLSGNRFTGEIPAEIKALPNWSNFNQSYIIPQQDGYGFTLVDDVADRAALMAIYEATGGVSWMNNTNWDSDKSVNLWYGVTCDANGKVTQLELNNNGLSGEIPAAIGSLTNLTRLNLSGNKLSGEIPTALANLTNLTNLSLNSNKLSGTIPAALGSLTNLTNLYLSYNTLSGTLPAELGQLKKLYQLSLYNNNLAGALPKELGQLTGLGHLNLNDNQFSGELPVELDSLTNLYTLELRNNNLEGLLPKELGGLKKLNTLQLSGNRFTGEIPAEIKALPNWPNFDKSYIVPQQDGYGFTIPENSDNRNALLAFYEATGGANWKKHTNWNTDEPINLWYGVTCDDNGNVTELNLNDNGLSGEIPAEIGKLTGLTSLDLNNNRLSGPIPIEIGQLTELKILLLGSNQFTGNIPVQLGLLTKLSNLTLSNNQLSGLIPVELSSLVNLYQLYLYNNNLEGTLPKELGQLTGLGYLNLSSNQFGGELPEEIGLLTNLYSLSLSNNNLEGALPKDLGHLTRLTYLYLSGNRFTGEIPAEITALPHWSNFDLAQIIPQQDGYGFTIPENSDDRNALFSFYEATGGANWTNNTNWCTDKPLSQWYGVTCDENGNVIQINLGQNGLSGEIPAAIGELTHLTYIYLWGNQLSGTIPVELAQLTKLNYLSLGSNQLSGAIPMELCSLTNLSSLHLSYNNLEGALPKELGQLKNLIGLDLSYNRFIGEIPAGIKSLPNWSNFNQNEIIPQQEGYGFTLADDAADRAALMAFYEATGGAGWRNNTNWGSEKSVNQWHGVTCDENGKVTQLNLNFNGLTGSIPAEIGKLNKLTYIEFGANQLSGSLPAEIAQLSELTHLWLNSNQLEGSFPVGITQLTKLQYLSLHNNRLSGTIPAEIGALTNLFSLYLNDNNLEGTPPKELGKLKNLGNLTLSGNRFTGGLPAEIVALPNWSNFNPSSNILPQQSGYSLTLP